MPETFSEWYEQIALNCFRYLDFKSFAEVDKLTMPEYDLLMQAVDLKMIDEELRIHKQSYLNHVATATKVVGKKEIPVYSSFEKFFDYKSELKQVKKRHKQNNTDKRFDGLGKIIERQKEAERNG